MLSLQLFVGLPLLRLPSTVPYNPLSRNAVAIESEAKYPFGGNVYYVTMQITLPFPEFSRIERNLHCDVLYIRPLPPIESPDSFWMTRSQRSRRRDKGLSITLVRPSDFVTCPYHSSFRRFTVARNSSYSPIIVMLYDGFPFKH